MSSESVCQVARSWVDVGSFNTGLFIIFMILPPQSGIFSIYLRTGGYYEAARSGELKNS
jgi:hypothetical protein